MSAKKNNQIERIGNIFDEQDRKFISLKDKNLEKFTSLPERKEARVWPKVTL